LPTLPGTLMLPLPRMLKISSETETETETERESEREKEKKKEKKKERGIAVAPAWLPGHEEDVLILRVALAVIVGLVAACSGVEVPVVPDDVPVTYAEHLEPLVIARCLSCHTAEEPEAQLVLESGAGYGQMVGRPSTQVPGILIVAPGDVEASYLWRKLIHDVEIGKGMPRTVIGSIHLPEQEVELYRRWIEDGALP